MAKALYKKFKTTVLNPDNLSQTTGLGNPKTTRLGILKYRYLLDKCIEEVKDDKNIIWEQPWRKIKNIQITTDSIKKSIRSTGSSVKFLVVEMCLGKNTSWDRSRNKFTNSNHFEKYISKYQEYNLKLPCLRLDGTKNTAKLVDTVSELLKTLVKDKTTLTGV